MTKKQRRSTNTYRPGSLAESPYVPHKTKTIHGEVAARNILVSIGNDASTLVRSDTPPPSGVLTNPAEILRAFGYGSKVERLYSHMPPLQQREQPETWNQTDDPTVQSAFSIYRAIAIQICRSFSGQSEDAGNAFWRAFLLTQCDNGDGIAVTGNILTLMASCLAKAKKGSIEKRVIRAMICKVTSYDKMKQLCQLVPGFSMSM